MKGLRYKTISCKYTKEICQLNILTLIYFDINLKEGTLLSYLSHIYLSISYTKELKSFSTQLENLLERTLFMLELASSLDLPSLI